MSIRYSIVSLFLALLPFLPLAGEHGIRLSLSPDAGRPGDVFELRAEMTRPDYAEFELKIPKLDGLYFVTQRQDPIFYANGLYRQSAVWVFQPRRAGNFEWTDIRAIVQQGEDTTEYTLPDLAFEVIAYAAGTDNLELEPLPGFFPEANPSLWMRYTTWLSAFLFVGILGGALVYHRRQSKRVGAPALENYQTRLEALRRALASGEAPVALMERLLSDEALHPSLREPLESALYNPKGDPAALRLEIEEAVKK